MPHKKAEEAQLCQPKVCVGSFEQRQGNGCLHPWRRTQPPSMLFYTQQKGEQYKIIFLFCLQTPIFIC